ncbi:MAG: sulfotransferase domain-containing protein [Cyanobacteriota bacterium]|nr:sulfotransferase domain-containing protein [Cyanobacteriota bacterium]
MYQLSKTNLVNPIKLMFGIKQVLPDDIYLASYPRSGNTWTRNILAYLVNGVDHPLGPDIVSRTVPDAYISQGIINQQSMGRIIKIHETFLQACPRVIYVHRDYRESMVSYWHFYRRTEQKEISFSRFIRSPFASAFGSWTAHMQALQRRMTQDPLSIHVIRYADLVDHFEDTVSRLVGWCGIGKDVNLSDVKRRTDLKVLAQQDSEPIAQAGSGDSWSTFRRASGESFYVDRGKGADWRSTWSQADLAWLARDRTRLKLMQAFGYD